MKCAVDISLYPLSEDFIPPIDDVIHRLNEHSDIEVSTNAMSTQLIGDYDSVMDALKQEMRGTFDANPKAIFVIKVLNNPLDNADSN